MNLQELEKNAADLQAKLDEMNAAIEKMKAQTSGFWKPEICEDYYFIGCDGSVEGTYNEGNDTDKRIIKQGNAYRTHEEAERARDKQKVTQRLRELAGGYRFKRGSANWFVIYDTDDEQWYVRSHNFYFTPNAICFPTEEAALSARDELGSRLNVLLEIDE